MKIKVFYKHYEDDFKGDKNVVYFDIAMSLGDKWKYLAVDEDGQLVAFEHRPSSHGEMWDVLDYSDYVSVAEVDLEGLDWKETLKEV